MVNAESAIAIISDSQWSSANKQGNANYLLACKKHDRNCGQIIRENISVFNIT